MKNKRAKKIRNLVFICVLSAILLTVSTYAWFIGMQTVRVNPFDVEIAATDGLALSVDGVTFSDTVTINGEKESVDAVKAAYATNTNSWTKLKPVSTIGTMDFETNGSRMILFEKSSLTAQTGGYRLLSEQLVNNGEKEAEGYVAFDLFVKNLSGEKYYAGNNEANEEAIYLTYDSAVTVGTSGFANTGIENSVRVAFAQIGRAKADKDSSVFQALSCDGADNTDESQPTGICRKATIWEPNDTKHVANAISWYNKSCAKRAGEDESCTALTDGTATTTYAVAKAITENSADDDRDYEVDIYDGHNGYQQSITDGYLNAVDTFTETERGIAGNADTPTGEKRNVFMTLAPNSVTKVRVYVYIEGQDLDNYDFAQLGKAIKVNFGFTKERFTTDDYTDETVTVIPGAENTKRVGYTATSTVSAISDTGVVYDATSKAFYYHEDDEVTTFTFKDGETQKTATYASATGWTITPAAE